MNVIRDVMQCNVCDLRHLESNKKELVAQGGRRCCLLRTVCVFLVTLFNTHSLY